MNQKVEMSHSEKVDAYRMLSKETLIEMLIQSNDFLFKLIETQNKTYTNERTRDTK